MTDGYPTSFFGNYLVETLGWNDILVTIMNMACNLVTEYLYDRYFVFGKTIDTNTLIKKEIKYLVTTGYNRNMIRFMRGEQ